MERFTSEGLIFEVTDTHAAGGTGTGEVVVLLHGFPQDRHCWDAVTPALTSAGYRVLAPDQRGYSAGGRPAGRRAYAISRLAADVLALADAAGAERFHLVGHDWGAAWPGTWPATTPTGSSRWLPCQYRIRRPSCGPLRPAARQCGPGTWPLCKCRGCPSSCCRAGTATRCGRLCGAPDSTRYVDGPYQFETLAGVSHWLPEKASEQVATLLTRHLATHPS